MAYDSDLFKDFKIIKRKPLNIINNLIGRELGTNSSLLHISSYFSEYSNKNQQTKFNHLKCLYLCVTPNYTILNVKTPSCFIRKFSPDGTRLIAFHQNLNSIQIFLFKSPSAGIEHIKKFNLKSTDKTNLDDYESYTFRSIAFNVYFKQLACIQLIENNQLLNRDCILFFMNSFLIVASSETVSDDNLPPYSQLASNNESIHYGLIENYTIYLIDIKKAIICDKLIFKADKLNLTHNQAFGLFNNIFTVLSLQNQTIHVYNLVPIEIDDQLSYKFVLKQSIGRFCFDNDYETIRIPHNSINLLKNNKKILNNNQVKGFNEHCLTSMKQRILSYFFKTNYQNNTLNEFYLSVNNFLSLRMHKLQLLDDTHILIKYVGSDYLTDQKMVPGDVMNANNLVNENSVPFYFVLYNMKTGHILNIIKNTSSKLVKIFENFQDYFSLTALDSSYYQPNDGNSFSFYTLPSNNIYSRQSLYRNLQNISKFNNHSELTKCILSQLPISPQTFSYTPYLDHSLFCYDEKLISNLERPKAIGDQVIKFNIRNTGRFSFRLYPGRQSNNILDQHNHNQSSYQFASMKRLVTFIWHPYQPFCISIQRNANDYNVNFHVYIKNSNN
jgi:de-etiolated-1